jgi:hypothetical protein
MGYEHSIQFVELDKDDVPSNDDSIKDIYRFSN